MGNRNNIQIDSLMSPEQPLLVNEEVKSEIQNRTATIQEPFHTNKASIYLSADNLLCFEISSTVEVLITVHFASKEIINQECVTLGFESDGKFPQPVQICMCPGLSMQSKVPLDYALLVLENFEPTTYPVIIELVSLIQTKSGDETVRENTYLKFVKNSNSYTPKVLFQKLNFEGKSYELKDVFGSLNLDEPECDVCKEFAKDTIIAPCHHMCLCRHCANIMRGQYNSKCPICRTQVSSLVSLTLD